MDNNNNYYHYYYNKMSNVFEIKKSKNQDFQHPPSLKYERVKILYGLN